MNGYDLSYANGKVNFALASQMADFFIVRVSYGTGFRDSQYDNNKAGVRQSGKILGHYHYAYPEYNTPEAEADWFASQVDLQKGEFLALDFEEKYSGNNDDWARRFIDRVATHFGGYKPMFYSYLSMIEAQKFSSVIQDGAYLWLAVYDNSPTSTYSTGFKQVSIKQYKDNAIVNGISGSVDEDNFTGTKDDLLKLTYLYQPNNMVHFKVFVMHPNSINPVQTVYDGMDQDDHSNPVWNTLKDAITNKRIEIQREIDGSVVEDVVLDVDSIVAPLNTQIDTLTKNNQAVADQLSKVTGQLTELQTQDGLDQKKIIALNAQVTELTDAISKLRTVNGTTPITPMPVVGFWQGILLSIISIFHK